MLAKAAQWQGKAACWWQALTDCGWTDHTPDGRWCIHNWENYAGKLIARREWNKERMRVSRATHMQRTNHARAGATVPTVPTVPYIPPIVVPLKKTRGNVASDQETARTPYGEFKNVFLSAEEYEKLVKHFGDKKTSDLVERLSAYMKSKGKRYLNHYATMLNWSRDDHDKGGGNSRKSVSSTLVQGVTIEH